MTIIAGAQDAEWKAYGTGVYEAEEVDGKGRPYQCLQLQEIYWRVQSGCTFSEVHGGNMKGNGRKFEHGKFCVKNFTTRQ